MAGASRSSAKVVSQQAGHKGGAGGQPLAQADRVTQSARCSALGGALGGAEAVGEAWGPRSPSDIRPRKKAEACWSRARRLPIYLAWSHRARRKLSLRIHARRRIRSNIPYLASHPHPIQRWQARVWNVASAGIQQIFQCSPRLCSLVTNAACGMQLQ